MNCPYHDSLEFGVTWQRREHEKNTSFGFFIDAWLKDFQALSRYVAHYFITICAVHVFACSDNPFYFQFRCLLIITQETFHCVRHFDGS